MADAEFTFRTSADLPPRHHEALLAQLRASRRQWGIERDIHRVAAMSGDARAAHDATRLRLLSRGIVVNNRTVTNLATALARVMEENAGRDYGGQGVLFESPSGSGKTTAVRSVLASVLAQSDATLRDPKDPEPVAVGYISVPLNGHPKNVYNAIADFLGTDYKFRRDDSDASEQVVHQINESGIQVLAFDEAQNLRARDRDDTVADAIRTLSDSIRATVILAGHSARGLRLSDGNAGNQVENRFDEITAYDFANDSQEDWEYEWRSMIKGLLVQLPLHSVDPDLEAHLWEPLLKTSCGSVKLLNRTLTTIARQKIKDGNLKAETITAKDVRNAKIPVPKNVREHRERILKRTSSRSRTAA